MQDAQLSSYSLCLMFKVVSAKIVSTDGNAVASTHHLSGEVDIPLLYSH